MAFQIMPAVKRYVIRWNGNRQQLARETGVSYETLAKVAQGRKKSIATRLAQAILDHEAKQKDVV